MGTNWAWGVRQREKLGRKPRFLAEVNDRTVGNPGEAHDMFNANGLTLRYLGDIWRGCQEARV